MRRHVSLFHVLVVALLLAALSGCAGARGQKGAAVKLDPAKVPNPYHSLVDIEFVKPLVFEAMLSEKAPTNFMIIDARPKQPRYDKGHIPTAVSLPDAQFEKMAASVLPADKSTLLLFYCGGTACPLSHQSAWKAEAMGYTNVHVYPAGDPEWVEKGLVVWTAEGAAQAPAPAKAKTEARPTTLKAGKVEGSIDNAFFAELVKTNVGSIQLIDARSATEFAAAHIPGSVNKTVDVLEKEIATFTAEKPIVFVCSTGARSGEAYYMFKEMRPDLKDVYYVDATVDFAPDGSIKIK